jgi:hypothetical protein
MIIVAGVIFVAALVLILVLTLKSKSSDDDGGGDTPLPGGAYNPYAVDESSVVTMKSVVTGNILMSQSKLDALNSQKLLNDGEKIEA